MGNSFKKNQVQLVQRRRRRRERRQIPEVGPGSAASQRRCLTRCRRPHQTGRLLPLTISLLNTTQDCKRLFFPSQETLLSATDFRLSYFSFFRYHCRSPSRRRPLIWFSDGGNRLRCRCPWQTLENKYLSRHFSMRDSSD